MKKIIKYSENLTSTIPALEKKPPPYHQIMKWQSIILQLGMSQTEDLLDTPLNLQVSLSCLKYVRL